MQDWLLPRMRDWMLIRRNMKLAIVAVAAGFGVGAWLLIGPLWAIAGVVAGPVVLLVGWAMALGFFSPNPQTLVAKGRPEVALGWLRHDEAGSRLAASRWPSQFLDLLAFNLKAKADALLALHRYAEALRSAEEGAAICQRLAADNPARYRPDLAGAIVSRSRALAGLGRQAEAIEAIGAAIRMFRELATAKPGEYLPGLAEALTCMADWLADIDQDTAAMAAAHEATGIYWHKMPGADLPTSSARAALLEGRLLCRQTCYNQATKLLARGWTLATRQQQHDLLSAATPALMAAYRADPDDFATVWRSETGSRPPGWLTTT